MSIVIPYVKQTWTDNSSQANAARLGVLEEGILDVSQPPAVRTYRTTNFTLTSGVGAAVTFTSERFDQAGGAASTMHDNSSNQSRLTARYDGIYLISGAVEYAANATGIRQTQIKINNTSSIGITVTAAISGVAIQQTIQTLYQLATNDYAELICAQNSGGNLDIVASGNYSPEFMMVRVA